MGSDKDVQDEQGNRHEMDKTSTFWKNKNLGWCWLMTLIPCRWSSIDIHSKPFNWPLFIYCFLFRVIFIRFSGQMSLNTVSILLRTWDAAKSLIKMKKFLKWQNLSPLEFIICFIRYTGILNTKLGSVHKRRLGQESVLAWEQ